MKHSATFIFCVVKPATKYDFINVPTLFKNEFQELVLDGSRDTGAICNSIIITKYFEHCVRTIHRNLNAEMNGILIYQV